MKGSLGELPAVWTASGNNRVHLWNVMDGTCQYALSVVGADKENEVVLNSIPINVRSVVWMVMIGSGSSDEFFSGEQGDQGVPAPHQRARLAAYAQAAVAV